LEDKIDKMERELDDQLQHNGKIYFTNKELVKATQNERERELARHKIDEAETKKNLFHNAFEKREDDLRRQHKDIG